jgi:hypothetical protein
MKTMLSIISVLALISLAACSSNNMQGSAVKSVPEAPVQTVQEASPSPVAVAESQPKAEAAPGTQLISDIQKPENIGKSFIVRGKVISTMQTSRISGYKMQDSTGMIDVSSRKIPPINSTVTVTGNLIQSRFFGLIINATG